VAFGLLLPPAQCSIVGQMRRQSNGKLFSPLVNARFCGYFTAGLGFSGFCVSSTRCIRRIVLTRSRLHARSCLCVLLGLCVAVILWAPGVHAQQIDVSLEPPPSTLSSEALANSGILLEYKLRVPAPPFESPRSFFAGLRKHPRSLLESHVREVILSYRKHKNQYLRCKLRSGRVLVGTVSHAGADSFFLQTGLAAR